MKFLPTSGLIILSALTGGIRADSSDTRVSELKCRLDGQFRISARIAYVIDLKNNRKMLSLTDGCGYAFATTAPLGPDRTLTPGDIVYASGNIIPTVAKTYSRANITNITVVGRAEPDALPVKRISDILSGRYDWHPVKIHGILRDIRPSETNKDWLYAVLGSEGSVLLVDFPRGNESGDDFDALIGAEVSIAGFCNPQDGSFRLHQGRIFQCNGLSAITVAGQNQSADPYSSPRIESIRYQTPEQIATLGKHLAVGRTLATWNGNMALVELPNRELLQAKFTLPHLPPVGACIEVVGLPESNLFHLNLTQAVWRQLADGTDLPPVRSPSETISPFGADGQNTVHAACHGKTVKLTGVVRSMARNPTSPDVILHLEIHETIIPIVIPKHGDEQPIPAIGSTISISGICILTVGSRSPNQIMPQITGFSVVVNHPKDIRTISLPPWWTSNRIWSAFGILFAALCGIFFWNITLRKTAIRKGRSLFKEQIERAKANLRTEERTQLAVELHDTLAQNLTGVSMEIEAAHDLCGTAQKPMLDHLDIAAKVLNSCRNELRNCLWDLRSQALDESNMTQAILRTLQPCVADSRLSVRFNVPRLRLSDSTAHVLLRVVRELVVNAIRHGAASSVRVAGVLDSNKLLCSVTDNGRGFDPDNAPGILQGHFGLQGIRERIDELNGQFTLSSELGKWTKAEISIPISPYR